MAPELGVAIAMGQYLEATEFARKVKESKGDKGSKVKGNKVKGNEVKENKVKENKVKENKVKENKVKGDELTKTHAFYANMGGFIMKLQAQAEDHPGDTEQRATSTASPDVVNEVAPNKEESKRSTVDSNMSEETPPTLFRVEDWKALDYLRTEFPDLEFPAEEDIQDRSKADAFTKAFAIVQSSWLIIQSIARVSIGLPITQLELATMAFIVCALVMYTLWWDKPYDVEHTTTIIVHDISRREEAEQRRPTSRYRATFKYGDRVTNLSEDIFFNILGSTMSSILSGGADFKDEWRKVIQSLAFYGTGTVFSAFHVAAWNWEFPSSTVRTLWRSFGVAATSIGPLTLLPFLVFGLIDLPPSRTESIVRVVLGLTFSFMLVYVISRLALIVLIFYCFSSTPAGVYETVDWTKFLPHFS